MATPQGRHGPPKHDVLVGSDLTMAVAGGGGDEGEGGGGPRCGLGPKLVTDSGKGAQSTGNRGLVSNKVGARLKLGAHSCKIVRQAGPAQPSPAQIHNLVYTNSMKR